MFFSGHNRKNITYKYHMSTIAQDNIVSKNTSFSGYCVVDRFIRHRLGSRGIAFECPFVILTYFSNVFYTFFTEEEMDFQRNLCNRKLFQCFCVVCKCDFFLSKIHGEKGAQHRHFPLYLGLFFYFG